MREVTAEELATWLAELPVSDDDHPGVVLDFDDDEMGPAWRCLATDSYMTHDQALALWFTAATLYVEADGLDFRPTLHPADQREVWAKGRRGTGPTIFHALAAAVRRVRAEGKRS